MILEAIRAALALIQIIADMQAAGAKLTADQQAAVDRETQRIAALTDALDTLAGKPDANAPSLFPPPSGT